MTRLLVCGRAAIDLVLRAKQELVFAELVATEFAEVIQTTANQLTRIRRKTRSRLKSVDWKVFACFVFKPKAERYSGTDVLQMKTIEWSKQLQALEDVLRSSDNTTHPSETRIDNRMAMINADVVHGQQLPTAITAQIEKPTIKSVSIYTDGACRRNPGPGGYGCVLLYAEHRKVLSGGYRCTTNNRMEIMAAIVALRALNQRCRVNLFSDSQYLVNGVTKGWAKRWRANNWMRNEAEPAINPDLWEQLLALCF